MTKTSAIRLVAGLVCAVSVVACGSDTPAQACAQGPLFASARQRAERAVSELDGTTSIELEESVIAIADRVALMREVSPRSLRDPLGVLLAAYGQLVVALNDTGWDPASATNDPRVMSARAAFAEESVAAARTAVEDFLAEQCELARGASDPNFALTGTTLPLPEGSEEPSRDATEDDGATASELQSFGFAIGDSYGVVLDATQAECIARALGVTYVDGSDSDIDDDEFLATVSAAFTQCGVTTPPTTTPDN